MRVLLLTLIALILLAGCPNPNPPVPTYSFLDLKCYTIDGHTYCEFPSLEEP